MSGKNIGLFLDRDGTVNEEVNFLASPDGMKLIPNSAAAIREANQLGVKVFILTNQSGIARGYLTEEELANVHDRLLQLLQQEGAVINDIYVCPHHPDYGEPRYRLDCQCRKPKTGMMLQAARKHNVNLQRSFVIGDRMIDVQMGNNAGAKTILVMTGYGQQEYQQCLAEKLHIDYVAKNLYEGWQFVKRILQTQPQQERMNSLKRMQ